MEGILNCGRVLAACINSFRSIARFMSGAFSLEYARNRIILLRGHDLMDMRDVYNIAVAIALHSF